MKPTFALMLDDDRIGLSHESEQGLQSLGSVLFGAPEMDSDLAALRDKAVEIAGEDITTTIVLPNDQILYGQLSVADEDPLARAQAIRVALDGRTPYAVEDLIFDWNDDGDQVSFAAVARETLQEAESFARQHGFNPQSFTAHPDDSHGYAGLPRFDPAMKWEAPASPVEAEEVVEAPQVPVIAEEPEAPRAQVMRRTPYGGDGTYTTLADEMPVEDFHSILTSRVAKVQSAASTEPQADYSASALVAAFENAEPAFIDLGPEVTLAPIEIEDEPEGPAAEPDLPAAAHIAPFAPPEDDEQPEFIEIPEAFWRTAVEAVETPVAEAPSPEVEAPEPTVETEAPEPVAAPVTEEIAVPVTQEVEAAVGLEAVLEAPEPVAPEPQAAPELPPAPQEVEIAADVAPLEEAQPLEDLREEIAPEVEPVPEVIEAAQAPAIDAELELAKAALAASLAPTARPPAAPAAVVPPLPAPTRRPADTATPPARKRAEPSLQPHTPAVRPAPSKAPIVAAPPAAPSPRAPTAQTARPTVAKPDAATAPPARARNGRRMGFILTGILLGVLLLVAIWAAMVLDPPQQAQASVQSVEVTLPTTPPPEAEPQAELVEEASPASPVAAVDDLTLPAADQPVILPPIAEVAALPPTNPDLAPSTAPQLPEFGSTYQFDEAGRIKPTAEGVVTPDGVTIFAGRPDKMPPARPVPPTPEPHSDAAPVIEADRPANSASLVELAANGAFQPITDAPARRPSLRPAEITPPATPEVSAEPTLDLVTRRPPKRPDRVSQAAVEAAKLAEAATTAAAAAAASTAALAAAENSGLLAAPTVRPATRPANLRTAVAAPQTPEPTRNARAAVQEDLEDDEPDTPARAAPAIPTRASVARQATLNDAINLSKVNLIGVFGTANNRYALVRESGGRLVKVRVGDRLDGGQVVAIGQSDLQYRKGRRDLRLQMPRG